MAAPTLSLADVTIGVITALPIEFAATTTILRCYQELEKDGRIYKIGQVPRLDERGYHIVAVTCLPTTGNNIAAIRTTNLKQDCPQVTEVIMCGIAGAVPYPIKPSDHVRLGDVVVTNSRGVVQYDFGRDLANRFLAEPRWFTPSRRLQESARVLEASAVLGQTPWLRHLEAGISLLTDGPRSEKRWLRPNESEDELREFDGARFLDYLVLAAKTLSIPNMPSRYRPQRHPEDPDRTPGAPRIFGGVIASANVLQKNPSRRNYLRKHYGARAVEMEGSGLAEAADAVDMNFFVVRGTVDYCNPDKNNNWHHYAALAAAAYTFALLQATSAGTLLLESTDSSATSALSPTTESIDKRSASPPLTKGDLASAVLAATVSQAAAILETAIEDDARSRLSSIDRAFETLDFQIAVKQGDELASWLENNLHRVSSSFLIKAYTTLARVQVFQAQRAVGEEKDNFLMLAQRFILKAKVLSGSSHG